MLKKTARSGSALLGVAAGIAILLSGCGSSESSAGSNAAANSGGSSQSANGGSTQTASNQTLVQLDTEVAPGLDPDGADAADPAVQQVDNNIGGTLVTVPVKSEGSTLIPNYNVGQDEYAPALAESYSHKGTSWIFHLRHNAGSCEGNPLTAEDVVYTYERAKSVSGASPVTDFLAVVAGVFSGKELAPEASAAVKKLKSTEVKALNKYTVEIKQIHPDGLFPGTLAIFASVIFDAKAMKEHATASDPWAHKYTETTNLPSFGAYCLTKWVKGSEMEFTANPHYWGPKPTFTKVIVRQVPANSDRVAAVTSGQANLVTSLTPQEYAAVAKSGAAEVLGGDGNTDLLLGINYAYPPFNNIEKGRLIRQAIAYAMPYEELAKNIYLGTASHLKSLFPTDSYGYEPLANYETNIAKAKELMAKAGYPEGKGLPTNSPAFKLSYVAERAALLEPVANSIRTALAKIGINVSLTPLSQSQENTDELTKFNLGMWIRDDNRPLDPDVGYGTLLFYVSKEAGALEPSTNFANAEIDKLYAESGSQTGATRKATLTKIQQILAEELPLVPLLQNEDQIAVSNGITGYQLNAGNVVLWAPLK